jgi:hypothetical protein
VSKKKGNRKIEIMVSVWSYWSEGKVGDGSEILQKEMEAFVYVYIFGFS